VEKVTINVKTLWSQLTEEKKRKVAKQLGGEQYQNQVYELFERM
jgi:hypothetical protein